MSRQSQAPRLRIGPTWARALAVVAAVGTAATTGCRGKNAVEDPTVRLDASLRPQAAVASLRRLGGAHVHAVLRMAARPSLGPQAPAAPADADGGGAPDKNPAPPAGAAPSVTTTTDLWLDRAGNFRLNESNDQGGRRDVTVLGRDLFAAMSPDRVIRRPAEAPEPDRLLEQALGGPWAGWELLRGSASVETVATTKVNGRPAVGYKLSKRSGGSDPPGESSEARKWRDTLVVDRLTGEIRLDEGTGAVLHAEIQAAYAFNKGADVLRGEFDLRLDVDGAGTPTTLTAPEGARELDVRQRTTVEERALLGGLPGKDLR